MDIVVQLMMGVCLAASAGLRAWLPLLIVAMLKRAGYATLNPSFDFLGSDAAVVVFGVATVVEILADKVPGLDHALDSISTVVRPAAGTVLASSMIKDMDPFAAVILGMIVGGGPSLLVHTAKSGARAKVTLLAHSHGGFGNTVVSFCEDILSALTLWVTIHAPIVAFVLVVLCLIAAVWAVYHLIKAGKSFIRRLTRHREKADSTSPEQGPGNWREE